MKSVLGLLLTIMLITACSGNKPTEAEAVAQAVDSMEKDTTSQDTLAQEEAAPPIAADGLFDDFAYNFMRNKKFQKERIRFPLPWLDGTEEKQLTAATWKFDPLYSKRDVYTILFDNAKSMANASDTALKRVTVEMISLKKGTVKQYGFEKLRGAWMLTNLRTQPIAENVNSDFLAFYARFAADNKFQQRCVRSPFSLSVVDEDTEERITGTADAAQWFVYSPEFPSQEITNVDYGQTYKKGTGRVLVVSSTDGSMNSAITFTKHKGKWQVTKLENN